MVNSSIKTFLPAGRRWADNVSVLACFGLVAVFCLCLPVPTAVAEPIVILEYRGANMLQDGEGSTHPFRLDPDHSTHHKVRQDETLSHIIANYYGGSGMDKAFVQMAIVKKNRSAFVRANPNYLFAGKSLHLPSLNEIRAMLIKQTNTSKPADSSRDNREEIFFFGS